jgi:hypothetical protein
MQSLQLISWIEWFKAQIIELWEERPEQAYLLANQLKKIWDEISKTYSDKFKSYYDEHKELPGWFTCKISNRKTYCFEENEEWRNAKARLDFLETQIKQSTDSKVEFPNPESWMYIKPVTIKSSEVYSVTRK